MEERGLEKAGMTQKDLIGLLLRYQAIIKIGKVYNFNNQIVQLHIQDLYDRLRAALQREEQIVLRIRQSSVFVNGVRAKFDYSSYHAYQFLAADFRAKGIAAMGFSSELTRDELERFVRVMLKKDLDPKAAYARILRDLDDERVRHVVIEKTTPFELSVSPDKSAVRMYFAGISLVKEVFDTERGSFNLDIAERWTQSIFNHILDNESFVYGLTNIKNHDDYTLNHSVNVCILSVALGRRLGLTREELSELGISAFLHDLGKLDIPRQIEDKPGRLTEDERAVVERHAQSGAEKLIELKSERRPPLRAVQVALEHHLHADMSGYPRYVKKKQACLFSRIVKIVDYFDAITTPRVYRPSALTREEALRSMNEKSGCEFDPLLLRVFINMIGAHPVGSLVAMDTGEIGVVLEANSDPAFQSRPKVKVVADAEGRMIEGEVVDLTEVDPQTVKFTRTIVKGLDPDKYGIRPADYFLARSE